MADLEHAKDNVEKAKKSYTGTSDSDDSRSTSHIGKVSISNSLN